MGYFRAARLSDIVDKLREEIPSADAAELERDIKDIVAAIRRQKSSEQVAPGAVNRRLRQIKNAGQRLAALITDDDSVARACQKLMAEEGAKTDWEAFCGRFEHLASGRCLDDVEFAPAEEGRAKAYTSDVAEAAGALRALLLESTPPARALRRSFNPPSIMNLQPKLEALAKAAGGAGAASRKQGSALADVAEVARYGMKASSGGRPIETTKLVAAWGSHLLLIKLKLPVSDDPDGVLCRLSAMTYECATGELDADLSHAVKGFLGGLCTGKSDRLTSQNRAL